MPETRMKEMGVDFAVYGEFKCDRCNRKWASCKAWKKFGQKCQSCEDSIKPDGASLKLLHYYECKRCKMTWKNRKMTDGMPCKKCKVKVFPKTFVEYKKAQIGQPSMFDDSKNEKDPKGGHRTDLCEKCKFYGKDCSTVDIKNIRADREKNLEALSRAQATSHQNRTSASGSGTATRATALARINSSSRVLSENRMPLQYRAATATGPTTRATTYPPVLARIDPNCSRILSETRPSPQHRTPTAGTATRPTTYQPVFTRIDPNSSRILGENRTSLYSTYNSGTGTATRATAYPSADRCIDRRNQQDSKSKCRII